MSAVAPVIGVIGRDVPLELIDAAGARPRRLVGRLDADLAFADAVLGRGLDPAGRHLLATLLADRFAGLDAIVACSDSDLSQRLYYALREIARRMPEAGVPPLHIVDVLHLRTAASLSYTVSQVEAFATALEGWTGTRITAPALGDAIERRDVARDALLEIAARRPARGAAEFSPARRALDDLTGADAVAAAAHLRAVTENAPARTGFPVVVTGSADLGSGIPAALEQRGLLVVGDTLPDGEVGLALRTRRLTLAGVAERLWEDSRTAHRGDAPVLAAVTAGIVRERGARAVVVVVRRRDEAPLWDIGALRTATSVPVVALTDQPYGGLDDAAGETLARLEETAAAS